MRWTRERHEHEQGEVRVNSKFLLFPKTIPYDDRYETRWLETATWEEQYYWDLYSGGHWTAIDWVREEKHIV